MKFDHILFDLDGTLADPGEGIVNSFAYAFDALGIPYNRSELYFQIGPPLRNTFLDYGIEPQLIETAVIKYREYYTRQGMFENTLYDGIIPLLKNIKTQQAHLYVASSKARVFVTEILKHFQILEYFDFVGGCELDGLRSEKPEVIAYVLENAALTQKGTIAMIGDRKYDIEGAGLHGLTSIGVSYGYGTTAELEEAGADYIMDSVAKLSEFLFLD